MILGIKHTPMKRLLAILMVSALATTAHAQDIVGNIYINKDTIAANLKPVTVLAMHFNSDKEHSDFNHLRYNVAKVYPYAKMAGEIYRQMSDDMDEMHKRKEKRHYKKDQEKELREKFSKEIMDLNQTQGAILVKLINRETGNNCYAVLQQLKNPAAAFFYQMAAKHWGYDLKAEYKPSDNRDLEVIVQATENGYVIQ